MPPRRLAAACLGLTLALGTAPTAAGSAADSTALSTAADQVLPAVVQVVQDAHGSVRDSRDGSTHGPYDVTFEGTGFFVSADGYILTAAHIADPTPAELNDELVDAYIDDLFSCDPATTADQCVSVETAHHSEVVARTTAVDASTALHVLLQSMSPTDTGLAATVDRSSRSPLLDIAVIKVDGRNEPVGVLAPATPARGAAVRVIGYPTRGHAEQTDQVPTVTGGSVIGLPGPDPTSDIAAAAHLVEVDANIRDGDSGGPGVGADGTVIGVVSFGTSDTDNFLVSTPDVATVVAATPVRNVLGPVDAAWRDGLRAEGNRDTAAAAAAFQRCVDLNPSVEQCRDRVARAASSRSSGIAPALVLAVAAAAGLAGLGIGVVLMRARRRSRG